MENVEILGLLYNLPIIISIIAFTRYFVGLKTWKNYPTIALALSLFLIDTQSKNIFYSIILWGLFYAVIIGSATATRYAIRKMKLNFYGRMSFIYLSGTLLGAITLYILSFTPLSGTELHQYSILGLFLIASTIDETATLLFKKGSQEYIRRMVSTSILAFFGGLLLSWEWWNTFLAHNPAIIIFVILFDITVSLWSSLRLTEYIRFGSIIRNQK